jgi:hypothetical protein
VQPPNWGKTEQTSPLAHITVQGQVLHRRHRKDRMGTAPNVTIRTLVDPTPCLVVALIVTIHVDFPRVAPGDKNEVSRCQSEANWPPE